jgi:Holliday junction resolvase RusA-like endonuclease
MNDPVQVLQIAVLGTPAPQGSKRHVGHGVMVESSKKLRPWRDAVRFAAAYACDGRPPIDEPVRVSMVFTFQRPASHFGTGRNAGQIRDQAPRAPQGMPDLSKLVRSTEDALTDAGVWRDDARVVSLDAAKVYAGEHPDALTVPGAVIRVWVGGRPWMS